MHNYFEACLKLVHGWALLGCWVLPQVTKARRGKAARTYRVGWASSAVLALCSPRKPWICHAHNIPRAYDCPFRWLFVARMAGSAEIDVLSITSYGAKAVAVSESAAAAAEAFESEE